MLRFLGRGSAFHTENNCGFFVRGGELVLMDCPLSAFHRLRHIGIENLTGGKASGVTVLVTHSHSDHAGGLGMLIHFCFYVLGIPVKVIAPSEELAGNIEYLVSRLDGCDRRAYTIVTPDKAELGFTAQPIATTHAETLEGRCFGWAVDTGEERFVYTGDTNTLEPFLHTLQSGDTLYTEASAYDSPVHMYIDRLAPIIDGLREKGVKVFLMHLDDEKALADFAAKHGAELAGLYE